MKEEGYWKPKKKVTKEDDCTGAIKEDNPTNSTLMKEDNISHKPSNKNATETKTVNDKNMLKEKMVIKTNKIENISR